MKKPGLFLGTVIFKTARYNNFAVGSTVIEAILAGTL